MKGILKHVQELKDNIITELNNCHSINDSYTLKSLYEHTTNTVDELGENTPTTSLQEARVYLNSVDSALASMKNNKLHNQSK